MENKIIIDATDGILGRIASFAAKQAMLGKEVIIVNCNEALLTGNKKMILREYKKARARGGAIQKGPNFPKIPERIMKRTIRGMMKYKRGRGEQALKKIRCYNATPAEFEKEKKIFLQKKLKTKTIKLSELGELI